MWYQVHLTMSRIQSHNFSDDSELQIKWQQIWLTNTVNIDRYTIITSNTYKQNYKRTQFLLVFMSF
jgi:hypothetical protein